MVAAFAGRVDVIRELSNHALDHTLRDEEGRSPLFLAALRGKVDAMVELCSMGYSLNEKSQSGLTPMRCALFRREKPNRSADRDIG